MKAVNTVTKGEFELNRRNVHDITNAKNLLTEQVMNLHRNLDTRKLTGRRIFEIDQTRLRIRISEN